MRYCNESQTDQGKVLNNYYYITSILMASALKVILLQLSSFLDASIVERENCLLKGNLKNNFE